MSSNAMEITVLKKENEALELRHTHGMTFESIARQLGYANKSSAQRAYKRALARIEHPDRDDYFQAHIERLDALIETYTQAACSGDTKRTDLLLRIMSQQAELLGLKAPVQVQQEVIHRNGPRTIDDEVTELARVIDYIEGVAANIHTLPTEQDQGK